MPPIYYPPDPPDIEEYPEISPDTDPDDPDDDDIPSWVPGPLVLPDPNYTDGPHSISPGRGFWPIAAAGAS